MATLDEVRAAFMRAHQAGDKKSAHALASVVQKMMAQEQDAPLEQLQEIPEIETVEGEEPGLFDTVADAVYSPIAAVKEAVTGEERTTEEVSRAPDWLYMPELDLIETSSLSDTLKTQFVNLFKDPQTGAKALASNFPGVTTRQDDKGNVFVTSGQNGREYAIKPGFQPLDLGRVAAGTLAFTPAGRAATAGRMIGGTMLTQGAIEAGTAASGGEASLTDIALAGGLSAVLPGLAVGARIGKGVIGQLRGLAAQGEKSAAPVIAAELSGASRAIAPEALASGAAGDVAGAAQAVTPPPATLQDLAKTAKKAGEGGLGAKKAVQVLSEQASPDPRVVNAADRLGISGYLQPDHVTTSQAYRELAQAVKSVPGSQARAAEMEGLEGVAKAADDLVEKFGGTHDLSALDSTLKTRIQKTTAGLEDEAEKLYGKVRAGIKPKERGPATSVMQFVRKRAAELDGPQNLSTIEKKIYSKLHTRTEVLASGQKVKKAPTYALIDDVRRDVGAALHKGEGPFKDADRGLLRQLYARLSADQEVFAEKAGMLDVFKAAKAAVATRKGLEEDLTAIFGKHIDGSIVGELGRAVKALPTGDVSGLVNLIKVVPENMRGEMVASGLASAFGQSAKRGEISHPAFVHFWEGLSKNSKAKAALFVHLPAQAKRDLRDLYVVSKGITRASKEHIATGRIMAVSDEIKGADGLLASMHSLAKRSLGGAAAEAVTTSIGLPGAGIAAGIASALTKGKPNAMKAVDAVMSSPEFLQAARQVGKPGLHPAVRRLAKSGRFARFVRAVGSPPELKDGERWILTVIQGGKTSTPAGPPGTTGSMMGAENSPDTETIAQR